MGFQAGLQEPVERELGRPPGEPGCCGQDGRRRQPEPLPGDERRCGFERHRGDDHRLLTEPLLEVRRHDRCQGEPATCSPEHRPEIGQRGVHVAERERQQEHEEAVQKADDGGGELGQPDVSGQPQTPPVARCLHLGRPGWVREQPCRQRGDHERQDGQE